MTDLKKQLTTLIQLQQVDSEIYTLQAEKASSPVRLKAIEEAFEAKKQDLAALEKKMLDLQKLKKERELELGVKEEAGKKLQSQLYALKTNKEYQAMLQQIEAAKADASVIEDKILAVMDETDAARSSVERERQLLQEEEKLMNGQKKTVEDRIKVIDDRLGQLESLRERLLPGIDPVILPRYQRILENRDGLAIVSVKNDSCGGCNMHLPPQMINLIRMYERIITCEVCNRILYIDDETPL